MKDYWARDLNVNIGRDNFDEIRYEYFRDPTIALEAFKADHADWRTENSAKNWAMAYDFSAVKDKRVILEEFPQRDRGMMRAFAFNTRSDKFRDARVRQAFNFAFDFEEMNKQFCFGQYRRINSYFEGTELACSGLPQGEELKILEPLRDKVPPEVFTTPYANPVAGTAEKVRANLQRGDAAHGGGRLRAARSQANQRQDWRGAERRDSHRDRRSAGSGALHRHSTSPPLLVSVSTSPCAMSTISSMRTDCGFRLRHHRRHMAAVAVARQRATPLLEHASGRYAGLAQLRRHQEPRGRCPDRPGDFRQESCRAGGGHQGARPCPAVEPVCRAAIHL